MSNARRIEAAARVRALHPPLPVLFAALRAEAVAAPQRIEPAPIDIGPIIEALPEAFADPLAAAFAGVAAEPGADADDLALRLAVAAEEIVLAAATNGAKAARAAGVPDVGDVGAVAVDAVIAVLQPYASALVEDPAAPPPHGLLDRVRAVARSAGVVEAVRGADGWQVVQRFGAPYCPRPGCYGRDGSVLTPEMLAAEGLPPYDEGCTCHAEPARA